MSSPYIGLNTCDDCRWWPDPERVIAAAVTTKERGVSITLQKIEYYLSGKKLPHRTEFALVLPSGDKLYSKSYRWTLVSLLESEDMEYLNALAGKKLLVKRYTDEFGHLGFRLI